MNQGANNSQDRIQIKICGLTDAETAAECARLGADALGLVFYPPSPRFVADAPAADIAAAVAGRTAVVGVFVDAPFQVIMDKVENCALTAVQLHGREPADLVDRLRRENLTVIKALFQERPPEFGRAGAYAPSAFLLECGRGRLPGGNAAAWDWAAAVGISQSHPVLLAGGLTPENVGQAAVLGRPDGVDVSSGVEVTPGKKDLDKIRRFIDAVLGTKTESPHRPRRIFS
jgi:phosphoribosylanthranilate isomerase/indole-3-glycerol phosphate synthase/phosphoribosylanthranilate isomerase